MRLTDRQLIAIRKIFGSIFCYEDKLWLFGSRAIDSKRGGDIDLYVETTCTKPESIEDKKLDFLGALQRELGEQKIDVVIKSLSEKKDLAIYDQARTYGVLLMQKQPLLACYIRNLDIHARRLAKGLARITPLLPMTGNKMYELSDDDASYLEVVNNRFSKMQDDIGAKVFPTAIELAGLKTRTFIDVLNAAEKLELLDTNRFTALWWESLRDLRNLITHDYQDDYELLARHTNQLIPKVQELLAYWQELKPKLEPFLAVLTNKQP